MKALKNEEMNNLFSEAEQVRYARHFSLPEIGLEGQRKLKAARVLVVGAGGLGSPVLLYLAAAGVGHIGIVDGDVVDASNLQRQVLYTMADIGKSKAEAAKERLQALNPHIDIVAYPFALTRDNALNIVENYDIIADGTDNFMTRYLVNDACVITGKVNVYASVSRFTGQVAVFNVQHADGTRSPNYRDIFPKPPAAGTVLNCAEEGILGVLPGIIGSMQANEVIKMITGVGETLIGKLALYDAAAFSLQVINIGRTTNMMVSVLIDYDLFCNHLPLPTVNKVTPQHLQQFINEGKDIQLIDVRQPEEHAVYNIGGMLIPLGDIAHAANMISQEKIVIFYCQSGSRSAEAVRILQLQRDRCENLFSLEGGINAWRNKEINQNNK
ncbi:MAG: molybdopterin-synthase adenylyltransferase MoeB [Saprospiraceae bacterium]